MPNCDICDAQFDVQRACDIENEEQNPELGWRYGYFLGANGGVAPSYPQGKTDGAICSFGEIKAASYYCRTCWNAACETATFSFEKPGRLVIRELLHKIKEVAYEMVKARVRV